MPRIFISYRRDDSAGYVGRLHDKLSERYGKKSIFTDIDDIPPGADFVRVIQEAVSSCDVLLAVIGKQWFIPGSSGQPRLYDPNDFVRLEIATALSRNITVIPVLVREASMPQANNLPPDLQTLARRNAMVISDRNFHRDVADLIKAIDSHKKRRAGSGPAAPRQRSTFGRIVRRLAMATGFVFLVLCAIVVAWMAFVSDWMEADTDSPDDEIASERIEPLAGLWEVSTSYENAEGCDDQGWEVVEEVYTAEVIFTLEADGAMEIDIPGTLNETYDPGEALNFYVYDAQDESRYSDMTVDSDHYVNVYTNIDDLCVFTTTYELLEAE